MEYLMYNLNHIESCYKNYISDLSNWLPDGVVDVSLKQLEEMDLLKYYYGDEKEEENLTRHFQVIESLEKITLINNQFIIWIVPDFYQGIQNTYALIAINDSGEPHLEMAFSAAGVYNTSGLVLRLLEKYLFEIQDTQELINHYEGAC